jgi:hypothetical protein
LAFARGDLKPGLNYEVAPPKEYINDEVRYSKQEK